MEEVGFAKLLFSRMENGFEQSTEGAGILSWIPYIMSMGGDITGFSMIGFVVGKEGGSRVRAALAGGEVGWEIIFGRV